MTLRHVYDVLENLELDRRNNNIVSEKQDVEIQNSRRHLRQTMEQKKKMKKKKSKKNKKERKKNAYSVWCHKCTKCVLCHSLTSTVLIYVVSCFSYSKIQWASWLY